SSRTSAIADMLGDNLELNSPMNILPLFGSRIQKKHVREPTNKPSNKKVKNSVKKESDILEDFIKELSTELKTQVPLIKKLENNTQYYGYYAVKESRKITKLYTLFINIKEDKIQRVKYFSALTISKLKQEDIDNIILSILKQKN
ncbi:16744_t:CDS:2, partial [Gigaspora margarita]